MIKLIFSEFKKNEFFYLFFILLTIMASFFVSCEIVQFVSILIFMRIQLLCIKNDYLNNTYYLNFYLPVKKSSVILSKILAGFLIVLFCFFIPKIIEALELVHLVYEIGIPIRNSFSLLALLLGFVYYFSFCHFTLSGNLKRIYFFNRIMAVLLIPLIILLIRFDYLFLPMEAFFTVFNYWIFVFLISTLFFVIAFLYSRNHKNMDI